MERRIEPGHVRRRAYALACTFTLGAVAACGEGSAPFAPITVVEGLVVANVGDPALNSVYIDFSEKRIHSVPAASWDLAVRNQGGQILINTGKKARVLDTGSSDFASVTSSSAAAYAGSYHFETLDGDLTKAAMGTPQVGRVYVLDLGSDAQGAALGYRRIQVQEWAQGSSIRLRWSALDGSGEQAKTFSLAASATLTHISLSQGLAVEVAPAPGAWDVVLTPVSVRTGPPHAPIYRLSVAALTNRFDGVQVAVDDPMSAVAPNDDPASPRNTAGIDLSRFAALQRADFAGLSPTAAADRIGRGWHHVLQPHSAGVFAVYGYMTYLVRDPDGRHFKFRFLSMVDPTSGGNGSIRLEFAEMP